jgi:hypothetical protein
MDELGEEKKFYQRFWALHADPVLLSVYKQFGAEPFRRSSVLEGFAEFVKETKFHGGVCVEIGTWKGLTAIVLSRYFDWVVSIDFQPDPQRKAIANFCGAKRIDFVTATDNLQKASVMADLKFDAAFVDGDHANDTKTDFALVRHCHRVLFHEYWQAQPPVWDLVNSLRQDGDVQTSGKFALWTARNG